MPHANPVTVRAVGNDSDRDLFLRVPDTVYRGDPHYVKPLDLERRDFLSRKNPYFDHAEVQLFVACDAGGWPVGRISAQIDRLAQQPDRETLGHFGWLEATDSAVMESLVAAAEGWLRARGVKAVQGPYSFSINDESGLLVEGFGSPARMLMNYARPWYGQALEDCGYAKAKDLLAFCMNTDTELPRAALIMARKALEAPGMMTERPLDPKRFDADLRLILDIFNDAWADNWGYVPMTEAEIAHTAKSLKLLIKPEFARIFERDGKPLAMIVALPDLNVALRGLHGRLLPFGWLKLLWRLKVRPPKAARVLLMGTRRDHRVGFAAGAMAAALVAQLRNALFDAGYTEAELSWVLEDNLPVIRLIESVGGVQYKRYRIYGKQL